jgi:hypothetical protein
MEYAGDPDDRSIQQDHLIISFSDHLIPTFAP